VVHLCLDGNSCAGLKGLCPSPGIKYYADGNSCAPAMPNLNNNFSFDYLPSFDK
jgi:hypothetical protein